MGICHPKELDEQHLSRWRTWQEDNAGWTSPFVSPSFARAVGACRDDTRVAIAEDGSSPAAYFAFQIGKLGIGQALGFGVSDHQAVIHNQEFTYRPVDLIRKCGLSAWEFDHVGQASPELADFVESWATAAVMEISDGYEAYLETAGLKKTKFYKSSLTKQRKLAAEFGELEFELDSKDRDALNLLLAWKSQQYKRTGRMDRFAVPWIRLLLETLFDSEDPDCRGMLSVLRAGDRVVALHFGLRNQTEVAMWFPAYDRDLSKYSPGSMFHLLLAEEAAKAGLQRLDLGKGDESYKSELRNSEYAVGEGAVLRRSPAASISWARRVPKRRLTEFVLRHERLRSTARKTLSVAGRFRS